MKLPAVTPKNRWLRLGTDIKSKVRVDLLLDYLATHLHVLGPPGGGKSRLLLWLFQELCKIPGATVILVNTKGDLGTMARDWCIAHGYTRRLVWFDPQDEDRIIGYNPLQPNHLPVATHAKNVREAIRSAWGQASFDQTAQLARFLFLVLFAVRELTLTLTEALDLLRPESSTRRLLLPAISDPYIREELAYLDGLSANRQDQLLAPTLARLQSFVLDPVIRRIITQQAHGLSLADVTRDKRILILDLQLYKPLALDDIKLLARFFINDLVAHVFSQPKDRRAKVFLILDECQNFATADLCRALDQGREVGLHCVLAHQYLNQLREEEPTGLLADSVMKCARTKILFGGLSTEELELLTPEVMIDRFDPWRVKDELESLECEPVESRREVVTEGESVSNSTTQSIEVSEGESYSQTRGWQRNKGKAVGRSKETGVSETRGQTKSSSLARGQTEGYGSSDGQAISSGSGTGSSRVVSSGQTIEPNDNGLGFGGEVSQSSSEARGSNHSQFSSATDVTTETHNSSESEVRTTGRSSTRTKGRHKSLGRSVTRSHSQGLSQSQSRGWQQGQSTSRSAGVTVGKTISKSLAPWYEYRKRRVVSSRQFLNKEEQMTLFLQQIQTLPQAHFLLKVPNHEAIFVRAPFVKEPWISERRRRAAMEQIYNQSMYSTPEQIAIEEQERRKHLQQLPPQVKAAKMKKQTPPTAARTEPRRKKNANREKLLTDLIKTPPGSKK